MPFQSAMKINRSCKKPAAFLAPWMCLLPCLSHPWYQPWNQITGSRVGPARGWSHPALRSIHGTCRESRRGENIFESEGLMDSERGCELCFHERIVGACWILQWRTRKKKPDDLGDKLHRLNRKSCHECWLLVNGSPPAGMSIQPLQKRIGKTHCFQAISEKEEGEKKSSFSDWAVRCKLLARL